MLKTEAPPRVRTEVQTITPLMAKEYLEKQTQNRKWRRDVVDRYKAEMLAGTWYVNGQPIIFDDRDHLIDGQHRLMAISESGKTVKMLVVFGVKPNVDTTIDMGKSRTVGDVFTMKGIRNAKLLARTSKLLLIWEEKFDELVKKRTFTKEVMNVHPQKIYEYYVKHQLDVDRACSEFKKNTDIITNTGAAVLSFVFSVFEKIDLGKCYVFITSFVTGNIKSDWPYMVKVRDELLARARNSKIHLTESERISIMFGLWNVLYNRSPVDEVQKNTLNIPLDLLKGRNEHISSGPKS